MNKSIFFELIKNVFVVIIAFIVSIIMLIALYIGTDGIRNPDVRIEYKNTFDDIDKSYTDYIKELLNNPQEHCISTIKIKDDKNNERYSSCSFEDFVVDGVSEINKVFIEAYYDENGNLTKCIDDDGMVTRYQRYIYNDSGNIISLMQPKKGYFPLTIYIYK